MNVIEAIKKRKSIRGFKNKPVPQNVIRKILDAAVGAPSAMNSQPWEFYVVSGNVLDEIKRKNMEMFRIGVFPQPDHHVSAWKKDTVWRERQVNLAKSLFALMDIKREDKAKRDEWLGRGFRFFDAPAAIIIVCDKDLGEKEPIMDIGAVMQTICLAAVEFNLASCIEDQGVMYPEVLREVLHIPDRKRIMISIAVGEEDPDFSANAVETERVPVDEITTWAGFDGA